MEYLILFLPLLGSFISGFFGNKIGQKNSEILTSSLVSISAVLSLIIFYKVITQEYSNYIIVSEWINSGKLKVNWSIYIDALSALMLVVVTLISAIVHIYSNCSCSRSSYWFSYYCGLFSKCRNYKS